MRQAYNFLGKNGDIVRITLIFIVAWFVSIYFTGFLDNILLDKGVHKPYQQGSATRFDSLFQASS